MLHENLVQNIFQLRFGFAFTLCIKGDLELRSDCSSLIKIISYSVRFFIGRSQTRYFRIYNTHKQSNIINETLVLDSNNSTSIRSYKGYVLEKVHGEGLRLVVASNLDFISKNDQNFLVNSILIDQIIFNINHNVFQTCSWNMSDCST